MKNKIKTIISSIWLILTSAMGVYLAALAAVTIADADYWISKKQFDSDNIVTLLFAFLICTSYIYTYLKAMIHLCRQLYKIKKWMICLPILASIAVIILSIVLFWADYQFI